MPRLRPYEFWTIDELGRHLLRQANAYHLPYQVRDMISEAINSGYWDPLKDFNGCTVVQDLHHPYLPCFIHDYCWAAGMGGRRSDRIFRKLLIKCGKTKAGAWLFYIGVRLGWGLYFKGKHYRDKNVRHESNAMRKLDLAL